MNQIYSVYITQGLPQEGGEWHALIIPEEHRYQEDEYLFALLRQRNMHAFKTADGRVFDIKNGWRPFEKPRPFPLEAVKTTEQRSQEDPEADGKNLLVARLIDAWCADKGHQIPWSKAIDIVAIVAGMDEEKVKELKAL